MNGGPDERGQAETVGDVLDLCAALRAGLARAGPLVTGVLLVLVTVAHVLVPQGQDAVSEPTTRRE
ncbi:hypothetical protein [Streptomyces sp. NPDC059489]|uniref:hypothetical protein n=1 Tax=Streptomyces sp. NPDC059489 TaxID=3346849 RepID=UPI00369F87F6